MSGTSVLFVNTRLSVSAADNSFSSSSSLQTRLSELERESEELRHLWKHESSTRSARLDVMPGVLCDSMFLNPEEENEKEAAAKTPAALQRWGSERRMKVTQTPDSPDSIYNHECSCVRRAEVVKYRGISLLNEVDAQYSALQVKYDELLRRSYTGPEEEEQSHKAVQTASLTSACPALTHMTDFEDDFHQPEYKELFREIFSRIQKTKEDLIENRGRPSAGEELP